LAHELAERPDEKANAAEDDDAERLKSQLAAFERHGNSSASIQGGRGKEKHKEDVKVL
jgi:hypothetical protein